MSDKAHNELTRHYGKYPKGSFHPLLAYAFRPFFLLLSAYMSVSIILWGLVWSGYISLPFIQNLMVWHIYEMLFGVASAGIIGFILTAIPEFYDNAVPVVGKTVLGLVVLWILGRFAFWFMDLLGVYVVALTNIPLLVWLLALVGKPIFTDPLKRNISLVAVFISIILIQIWFFVSLAGWVKTDFMSILKVALGAFMVLELLVLRRVNTEAINEWLEKQSIDDTFIAKPPAYNIAIFSIIIFTIVEFFFPQNSVLGWIALAASAAILNTLNDFFMDEVNIVFKPYILPLFLILVLMAVGYGLMGLAYLHDGIHGINHFRHFLTTGVIGLSFFMVMVIVGTIHTGRELETSRWVAIGVVLIIVATLVRSLISFYSDWSMVGISKAYTISAILWSIPFIIYLIRFYPVLSKPRVDGLPG